MTKIAVLAGWRVRQELNRRGLTQAQFAERLHLRQADISKVLNNHPITPEMAYRICLGLVDEGAET